MHKTKAFRYRKMLSWRKGLLCHFGGSADRTLKRDWCFRRWLKEERVKDLLHDARARMAETSVQGKIGRRSLVRFRGRLHGEDVMRTRFRGRGGRNLSRGTGQRGSG